MEEKLDREEVLHVATLARIEVTEEELERYQVQLKKLLDEVDKIKEVKNYDEEMIIAPIDHEASLRPDVVGESLTNDLVMKNVPAHEANFIEVPVMIDE